MPRSIETYQGPTMHLNADGGVRVDMQEHQYGVETDLPPGTVEATYWASSYCGSDDGYVIHRFPNDLEARNQPNDYYQRFHTNRLGLSVPVDMLATMNHECVGVVNSFNPYPENERYQEAAAVLPVTDETGITGVELTTIVVDQNDINPGDGIIIAPSYRCPDHRMLLESIGLPAPCHRMDTDPLRGDHPIHKATQGHMELPGATGQSSEGMRYPLSMATKVPDKLWAWAQEDPTNRMKVLLQTEPMGCCAEAFRPALERGEPIERIVVAGDSINALNLVAFADIAFPDAEIIVTGKTEEKLEGIKALSPDRITTLESNKLNGHFSNGSDEVADYLGDKKVDLLVPTFSMDVKGYDRVVKSDTGSVIIWAAEDAEGGNVPDKYTRAGNPRRAHLSFGGFHRAEDSGVAILEAMREHRPEMLDAMERFQGFDQVPFADSAQVLDARVNGNHSITLPSRPHGTSAKIVIDHMA